MILYPRRRPFALSFLFAPFLIWDYVIRSAKIDAWLSAVFPRARFLGCVPIKVIEKVSYEEISRFKEQLNSLYKQGSNFWCFTSA